MIPSRHVALLLLLSLTACGAKKTASGKHSASASAAAGAPSATRADTRWPGPMITARHPIDGVSTVVLRAGWRGDEKVNVDPNATEIVVQGRPTLFGVEGEGQADGAFVFQRFGDALLVATKGEYVYIHLGVTIEELEITVPANVTVKRERMVVNQDREPDLRPPGAPARSEGRP